jgi:hypoxanthine phosphoribosyltransferase
LSAEPRAVYSKAKLSARVAAMGRAVSKDYAGRTVDAVIILEDGFVFAADFLRSITRPVVCHFVRLVMRDVELSGFPRKEVSFSWPPELKGRDVLVVASILDTGVTMDFLCKNLLESSPRSLRIATLLDKPADRRVDLKPDYFGFVAASNNLVGYGLAGRQEQYRNLPYIGVLGSSGSGQGSGGAKRASGGSRIRRGKS